MNSPRSSQYEGICRESLAKVGRVDVPWQFLEAWMRGEYGTLDHLSAAKFLSEARSAGQAWDYDRATCIRMAEEYGYQSPDLYTRDGRLAYAASVGIKVQS